MLPRGFLVENRQWATRENQNQNILSSKRICPLQISEAAKEKMMPIVKLMQEASALQYEDKSLQASYFASLLSLLLIDMIRLGEWGDSSFSNVSSDSFQVYAKFVQMVEDNYIEHHAVKDYIEKLGVSQTTLNQYTQQYAKQHRLKSSIIVSYWRLNVCCAIALHGQNKSLST